MTQKYSKIFIVILLLFQFRTNAQLFVAAGETLHAKSGEIFYVDGLTLYPSTDFTLTDNELNRNSSTTNSFSAAYVQRVFRFNNNTASFSGTIEVNYLESELNSLLESELKTAIHNGTNWQLINTAAYSADNNYVQSNSVSSVLLNEITLARSLSALPVQWLSFTIQKRDNSAVLSWKTAREQNTKDFVIEHSVDGNIWETIGIILAKGSLNENRYSFTHLSPQNGRHYYRLLQRDETGRAVYSNVLNLAFALDQALMNVYPNPISSGLLNVQISKSGMVSMYNSVGIAVFKKDLPVGLFQINVNEMAKGTYFLRINNEVVVVVIQ